MKFRIPLRCSCVGFVALKPTPWPENWMTSPFWAVAVVETPVGMPGWPLSAGLTFPRSAVSISMNA
jgi:hypothetical protein